MNYKLTRTNQDCHQVIRTGECISTQFPVHIADASTLCRFYCNNYNSSLFFILAILIFKQFNNMYHV